MDDYIKRSDAINAIESLPTWWADEGGYYGGMQQPRVALLEPEDVINAINKIPSADVQPVGYTLEECGNYLLFLWMENILTDAEYNRAVDRFNKKIQEKGMDGGT